MKPETSVTEEQGYRFKRDGLTGDVSVYHVHFADRLLAVAQCEGIVGCPNALVNVGGVATNDNSVSGRMLRDFNLGYNVSDLGPLQDLRIRFNIINLFDQKYYSAIGTNGFVLTDAAGQYQTPQLGAPRTLWSGDC